MIRALVADDHRLVRRGIREILSMAEDIVVVGECASGDELLASLPELAPDIVVLDMAMPGLSGTELIGQLTRRFPDLAILVLSMHNEGQFVAQALREGARGYVTKDADAEILLQAVRTVAKKGRYIDPSLVEAIVFAPAGPDLEPDSKLTEREIQVLQRVVTGQSLNAIAASLHLSPKTISSHKMRIMQKLGVTNNADLVRYAMRAGLS